MQSQLEDEMSKSFFASFCQCDVNLHLSAPLMNNNQVSLHTHRVWHLEIFMNHF